MPTFDIIREIKPVESFRVISVRGQFDLKNDMIRERFQGNIDIDNRSWSIGIIYGRSGTGKSTIAKQIFPQAYTQKFPYHSHSILDDFPRDNSTSDIIKMLNSVGFSSVPSWLKPYNVLSTGERMRVDIARAILSKKVLIVFDEFTSTINREVAKIGSYAVSKTVRRMKKQFIAVTCHEDIIEWLEPDWTFCTNNFSFFLAENTKGPRLRSTSMKQIGAHGKCFASIII